MEIAVMKHDPIMSRRPARAFVLFRSGGRLDLLNPRFDCWTDEDLAHNLARISRWGGATRWHEPLSVAQHSRLGSDRSAQAPSRRAFSQARATAAGSCRRALRLAGVGRRRLPPEQGGRSPRRGL